MEEPPPASPQRSETMSRRSSATVQLDEQAEFLPLLIVGPPGTGKTCELAAYTAVEMVQHMARRREEDANGPWRALCLAETNTCVTEMRARVEEALRIVGQDAPHPAVVVTCDTLHHTCRRWLAMYSHLIGRPNFAEVCSAERAAEILRALFEGPNPDLAVNQLFAPELLRMTETTLRNELTIAVPNQAFLRVAIASAHRCKRMKLSVQRLQRFIKLCKIHGHITDALRDEFDDERIIAQAVEMRDVYDGILSHNGLLDFEDLIRAGVQLVEEHAPLIVQRERIHMVVLDDLQNTNAVQRRIVRALCRRDACNGRVVVASECNDERDQRHDRAADYTVFDFAGASLTALPAELMNECVGEEQEWHWHTLGRNWRSSFTIQRLANAIRGQYIPLHPQPGVREHACRLLRFESLSEEARFLVQEIHRVQIESAEAEHGRLASIAILVRSNSTLRFLADELVRRRVPLRIMAKDKSLSSADALDLISFLCAAQDPMNHQNVERSFNVYKYCIGQPALLFEELPEGQVMLDCINMSMDDFDTWGHLMIRELYVDYILVLRTIQIAVQEQGQGIGQTLNRLIERLHLKDTYLRTVLYTEMPLPGNVNDQQRDYAGARWQNVQELLLRARDFDDYCRTDGRRISLDKFLMLCHAYASNELGYAAQQRPDSQVVLTTMHYALG